MRLVNRRFIPFAFDLSSRGFLGDKAARDFVTKARPEYGGGSVSTPKLLIMTPEGKVVGSISNYGSTQEVLRVLQESLKNAPAYAALTEAEKEYGPYQRAELALDLLQYDDVYKALRSETTVRAHYMRGVVKRRRGQWRQMNQDFANVKGDEFADHVRVEKAYELWATGKFAELEKSLRKVRRASTRYSEAQYFIGIALFHQGHAKKAQAHWRKTIKKLPQDGWIYRADWALHDSQTKRGGAVMMTSAGNSKSALGRIGYMGRRNPDLTPR